MYLYPSPVFPGDDVISDSSRRGVVEPFRTSTSEDPRGNPLLYDQKGHFWLIILTKEFEAGP